MEELKKELQQMIADREDKVAAIENGNESTIGKVVQACYTNAQSDMAAELLQKYFGEQE